MTDLGSDRVRSHEEPALARYLAEQVCARGAGRDQAECIDNFPRDLFFIGCFRPCPPLPHGDQNAHAALMNELLLKLAPMALGAEFKCEAIESSAKVNVTLKWSCYYRVFPTLSEQSEYQRVATATQGETVDAQSGAEAPESEVDDETGEDAPQGPQPPPAAPVQPPPPMRGRRGQHTDSLFTKFRRILCSAMGEVPIGTNSEGTSYRPDVAALQQSIDREFVRVRERILSDPDHLRIGPNPDAKIRIPVDALATNESYQRFKDTLTVDVLPPWSWAVGAEMRPAEESAKWVFGIEASNSSPIDTRAWHTDGYFFDCKVALSVEGARVVPFDLELAPHGFRYDRHLWGRGFNCAVRPLTTDHGGQQAFETTCSPIFSQPRYTTNTEPRALFRQLADDPLPVLQAVLNAMRSYEEEWTQQRSRYLQSDPSWQTRHGREYEASLASYHEEISRFERGIGLVRDSEAVNLAFRLLNRAFGQSGQKTEWRLFQVVFIVSQLPGIHALSQPTPSAMDERRAVDIVYFPTGGGKTEAYLGVVVFHAFYDRLRGKKAGITAWTRFPLRLLTLQQTQRVADVIGAAELVRRSSNDPRLVGHDVDGFGVGYYVGQEATPNEITPPRAGSVPDATWSTANDAQARQKWKKIIKCPSCRTATVIVDFDPSRARLIHRCTSRSCRFTNGELPVYVVDNEIYRYLPCVLVGTIDKLATVGIKRQFSMLLGAVTGRCSEHGYYNSKCCQKECTNGRRLRRGAPPGISAPSLFIQDELHLLKEGLGTFDGHYETFLQTLIRADRNTTPVKILASSATIEAFERQIMHLYGRPARVFPGAGPTLHTSFYARTWEYPQRLFVGVLPHNKTLFRAMLALIQFYHEEIESLKRTATGADPYGGQVEVGSAQWQSLLDQYATSLTYFSATRELNSLRTDLEGHTNNELREKGLPPLRLEEMSGSTSTDNVTRILEQLEAPSLEGNDSPNAVLATSMISHGVDIDRLNCMFFFGMPKQNAEYIQSSSRVGRSHAGIVFTCMKPARERDRSHYSYFIKYHEFLGQLVEPVAINRWSKFSLERTLPGLFMAVLLQRLAHRNPADNPQGFYMVDVIKRKISDGSIVADDFIPLLEEAYMVNQGGAVEQSFRSEIGRRVRQSFDQVLGSSGSSTFVSSALIPPPLRSLRDVDEQIPIELDNNGTVWGTRVGR